MRKKASFVAATALSIPLLLGCGQGDTGSTTAPATEAKTGTVSPLAQTAHGSGVTEPTQATDSAAPAADPAATENDEPAEGAGQLPAVADPCAGQCTETARIPVEHPAFGAMEVVTYHQVTSPDGAAPSTGVASYALYQNGQPVGYVGSENSSPVVSFGASPALGGQTWELDNGSNVDKYGNVYLSYDAGVTVLTPTDRGYDSQGTMPPDEGAAKTSFAHADLRISEDGEPTVTQKTLGTDGGETGETVDYTWNGQALVPEQ